MTRITDHPKMTPVKVAELSELAKKVDREEKERIIAAGRGVFERHERVKSMIARLKAERQKRHLTLEQVAERSGIDQANLSRFENNMEPNPPSIPC